MEDSMIHWVQIFGDKRNVKIIFSGCAIQILWAVLIICRYHEIMFRVTT